jgi:hypothetical protein
MARIRQRICVAALALVVALVGIVPRADAYRCAAMGRMISHACCGKNERAETRIDAACCERLPARAIDARATSAAPDVRIAPAPLAGLLEYASLTAPSSLLAPAVVHLASRPPGEPHRLSTVLRI